MAGCPNCRHLEGESGDVDPRGEMRAVSQHFTSDGVFEIYRCRPCGSQWERFVAAEAGRKPGPWKRLGQRARRAAV